MLQMIKMVIFPTNYVIFRKKRYLSAVEICFAIIYVIVLNFNLYYVTYISLLILESLSR